MLDSTFVEAIQSEVQPTTTFTKVYNQTVAATGENLKEYTDPDEAQPSTLKISTLQGVVDYILASITDDAQKVIIHVVSPAQVDVTAPLVGARRNKLVYLTSMPLLPSIQLERYVDLESFIISLQSAFAPSEARAAVQTVAGKVKAGLAADIEDDGISQTVTTKVGITRNKTDEILNPYLLQPYRTFSEVEQPESPFILRLKQINADKDVLTAGAALFLADGEAWRSVAIASIGSWLRSKVPDTVTILA